MSPTRDLPERLRRPLERWREEAASLGPEARAGLARGLVRILEDGKRDLSLRVAAGAALGIVGDPRLEPLRPSMQGVPEGRFRMGMELEDVLPVAREFDVPEAWLLAATPPREVDLDEFEIARFPVTQSEWARFLADTGHPERPTRWRGSRPPPGAESHPVWGISWEAVLAYCAWISDRTGLRYRVPTEAEWEKAARGTDGRAYPWGVGFDALRANTRETGIGDTTPVGLFAEGASPYGVLDMAGNVEEYTASLLEPPEPSAEPGSAPLHAPRVTRGGCFALDGDLARCDRRHAASFGGCVGFRLARSRARRAWERSQGQGEER